jgi:hypothetical protein
MFLLQCALLGIGVSPRRIVAARGRGRDRSSRPGARSWAPSLESAQPATTPREDAWSSMCRDAHAAPSALARLRNQLTSLGNGVRAAHRAVCPRCTSLFRPSPGGVAERMNAVALKTGRS